MWYTVYNFLLVKNDTIVSVIICYDFYHNDFDLYCRTALSLNLWRHAYCDVIEEWRFTQSLKIGREHSSVGL